MFLNPINISEDLFVSDIVRMDYRTAKVFRRHEIDFCCGGKWSLGTVCQLKGIGFYPLKEELERSIRTVRLSNSTRFDSWSIDFLINYVINIHHHYLRDELSIISQQLDHFTQSHASKYTYLHQVQGQFELLCNELIPHMAHEEGILFPYIRQIAHAYDSKESYASLLVRTLRKPVGTVMEKEHEFISKVFQTIRQLTNNYTTPERACTSHHVTFSLLKELDDELMQHLYLENQILFPKAIAMEKELLAKK